MSTAPAFASVTDALDVVRAGLRFLATAARTSMLAGFGASQGYVDDGDYSLFSWLRHRTQVTRGTAADHTGWVKRSAAHPGVQAALAAEAISASYAREICRWTGSLPDDARAAADEILLAAAAAGLELEDLAALAAEMHEKSRQDKPGTDGDGDGPGAAFDDRAVNLATTIGGAGVIHGDLTPECAEFVQTVLDALSAPAGADDDRTHEQRYHDALQEAMRRLLAAGLLPERGGQPVRVWAHINLADLMLLEDSSALLAEWTQNLRARWAGHRAAATAPRPAPEPEPATTVRTSRMPPAALARRTARTAVARMSPPHSAAACPGRPWSRRSSARPSNCCQAPAGSPASCAATCSEPG
jgi:hypothetical protein